MILNKVTSYLPIIPIPFLYFAERNLCRMVFEIDNLLDFDRDFLGLISDVNIDDPVQ